MLETRSVASPFPLAGARASYGAILAQTMTLVACAVGVLTLGSYVGRDYSQGTALAFTIGGVVMLFAQSFVSALRTGLIGTVWLFALALALGLGLGPVLASYVAVKPDVVAQAAGMTGVITLGAASLGTFIAKDLASWMRPLSLVVLAAVAISWILLVVGSGTSPIVSGVIGVVSALLIVVDFNYLRRHATEDDVIWLATGIFVSIINIFLTLLNLDD